MATNRRCFPTEAARATSASPTTSDRASHVANPAALTALSVRFVRDDGAVIYLNGVEVVRSNMPAGTVSYTTLATDGHRRTPTKARGSRRRSIRRCSSRATNVLAVEIHQQSASSTDVSFDLELRATESRPAAAHGHPHLAGTVSASPTPRRSRSPRRCRRRPASSAPRCISGGPPRDGGLQRARLRYRMRKSPRTRRRRPTGAAPRSMWTA